MNDVRSNFQAGALMALSNQEWITPEILGAIGTRCYDLAGREIDHVRAVRLEKGGIRVRVYGSAGDGSSLVMTGRYDESNLRCEVCEFEGFVPGGYVIPSGHAS